MTFDSRDRPGPRWDRDPVYVRNRALLRAQRRRCARCGGLIDYEAPYWLPTVDGRKRINPRAFVAGHIIGRASGGGPELSNLQAEHARCSLASGAREGAALRSARARRRARPASRLLIVNDW